MRPLRSTVIVALLAACLSSCCTGPHIKRFDATPPILCEGETAILRWDVDGSAVMHLQTEPGKSAQEKCTAAGRETLSLTLVATKHGAEAQWPIEVVQLHPGATEPLAFGTKALQGGDVVASGEKNLKLWAKDEESVALLANEVAVTSVVACGGRPIHVVHAGKTASLSPDGTPSEDLAGTTLGGDWELRSPLSPGELKNPASRPKELKILASIRCKKDVQ